MIIYALTEAALVVLLAVLLVTWQHTLRPTIYRFRSVFTLSLCVMVIGAIAEVAVSAAVCEIKGREPESLIALIKAFPAHFSYAMIILIALLGFMMFISNLSLMKHEGMRPKNLVGTFLNVIFVMGTVVIYTGSQFLGYYAPEADGAAGFVCGFIPLLFYALIDYAECLVIGISLMGLVASKQKPAYNKDFIIILGCSISKTGGLLPLLRGRTNAAVRYAWDQEIACGKPVHYVPSGGQGPDEVMSEGSAMELYLLAHGAEQNEVFPEKKSRNTWENIKFSKEIIDSINPDAEIAFATTKYHVLRSGMIAHKQGFEVEGIGSDTKWYFWPNGFAREVVAIFSMTRKKHIINALIMAVICALLCVL